MGAEAHPWDYHALAVGPELAQAKTAERGFFESLVTDPVAQGRTTNQYFGDSGTPQKWPHPTQDGAIASTAVGDATALEGYPGRPRYSSWDGESTWSGGR